MPRHPAFAPSVTAMSGAVYSALAHRLASHAGEVFPLHIGDTWLEPAEGCRMEDLRVADHPGMHRYAPVQGLPVLLDAVVDRQRERTGLAVERSEVLITAGATGGLGAVVGGLLAPGDEVVILAPHWPLIAGIVRSFHGTPVQVPFYGVATDPGTAAEVVRAAVTERTVALYVSTPSNPTGQVLPESWLAALAELARELDLWLLSDECYEDYQYAGTHAYTRPLAPERTFATHSFSKAYGMAGNRCGYVVGPAAGIDQLRKVSTHTFYSTPTAAQLAAVRALDGAGDAWIAMVKPQYEALGRYAAARLGVPAPYGSTFVFLDVADQLGEDGLGGFLGRCVDRGLLVAPGPSFGPYPTHIRVCFTCAEPVVVRRGVDVLAELLGR